jgi:hypothetical protein
MAAAPYWHLLPVAGTLGGCSVFEIAGFFIVRAIYMIAEKESDLILKEARQLLPINVRTPRGS